MSDILIGTTLFAGLAVAGALVFAVGPQMEAQEASESEEVAIKVAENHDNVYSPTEKDGIATVFVEKREDIPDVVNDVDNESTIGFVVAMDASTLGENAEPVECWLFEKESADYNDTGDPLKDGTKQNPESSFWEGDNWCEVAGNWGG